VQTDEPPDAIDRMTKSGQLLPTPRANKVDDCDLNNPNVANRNKANLEEEISKMVVAGMLPTPDARVWKNANNSQATWEKRIADGRQEDIAMAVFKVENSTTGQTSRLSPLFTEEMMGFPFLWTTLPFLRQSGEPNHSKPTATQ
jgi:hypothetical protein